MNELIFICSIFAVSTSALIALRLGKEYLIGLISVMAVLVNLLVIKQIHLFGLTATASDALAVGITLSLNLMQEYYSKESAIRAIWVGFFCMLFYLVMTVHHLAYIPTSLDISNYHYQMIFTPMPRILAASFFTFLVVQYTDTKLYSFLKNYYEGRFFVARNYGSLAFTQLLDTVLFSFLGLYHANKSLSSITTVSEIILVSYTIKLVVIGIAIPYVKVIKTFYPVPS